MTPTISVVIAAFNPGKFLREAVESVLQQTYGRWELTVVDDGSTEDLSEQVPVDGRVRLVRQQNRGLSSARNAGIMRSSGDYIAFLDADDVWRPEKLEQQLRALERRPEAVLCHSQMRFIDGDGRPGPLGWGGSYETYEHLQDGCGVCVSSVVIRRPVLFACGLFDPLLRTAQDYDLWMKAARIGPMAAIPDPLVDYRWHAGNMSHNYIETYRELSFVLRRHLDRALRENDVAVARGCRRGLRRVRRNVACQAANHALPGLKRGAIIPATLELLRAGVVAPLSVAAELGGRAPGYLGLRQRGKRSE